MYLFHIFFVFHLAISAEDKMVSTHLHHGLSIPRIGFGTAGLGSSTARSVETALNAGYNLIDTAQAVEWYSEKEVSEGMRAFEINNTLFPDGTTKKNITVVTKIHPRSFSMPILRRDIVKSKSYLKFGGILGELDLVLIHSPYCWQNHCTEREETHTWQECWRNLETLKSEGHIHSIGVSNFDKNHLQQVITFANTQIVAVQNWCDPFHQDKEVRAYAAENGIAYMAYSSFGTQWTNKFPTNPVTSNKVLQNLASKHNSTVHEVVLSWLLQEGMIALPRSTNSYHILRNSFSHFKFRSHGNWFYRCFLDTGDIFAIGQLDGTLGLPWN
jgi:diketogulonate reductase-like aldo/keto reductase